jgi:hypothetical protein
MLHNGINKRFGAGISINNNIAYIMTVCPEILKNLVRNNPENIQGKQINHCK